MIKDSSILLTYLFLFPLSFPYYGQHVEKITQMTSYFYETRLGVVLLEALALLVSQDSITWPHLNCEGG
jgi:hypothetical protein